MVTVPLDDPRAAALLGRLARELRRFPGEFEKARVRVLNRTGAHMRTQATRILAERYAAKVGELRRKFSVTRASSGAPFVLLRGEGQPLHLGLWPGGTAVVRQEGRRYLGARVQILKGGGRKLVQGGFRAVSGRNQAGLIFKRKGQARYPLKTLYGPSLIGYLTNPRQSDLVENMARNYLELEIQREAQYRLSKLGEL